MNDFTDDYKVRMIMTEMDQLSKWEEDFIVNMDDLVENGKELTPRQKEVLDNLFRKYA